MMKTISSLMVLAAVCQFVAGCNSEPSTAAMNGDQSAARGKYLVENVGMCGDCHTPMGPTGPDLSRSLQGAELVFTPTVPVPDWVSAAPAIAGLPSLEDDEAIALLATGALPNGTTMRPPMPHFRMNRDDAAAVVAYLRSLGTAH
jgi:mono/diheme cytochrome c family protein